MKVMKFGGTSVGSVNSILSVKRIVEAVDEPVIVVVSALGGITDKLINTSRMAAAGDASYENEFREIVYRHVEMIKEVIPAGEAQVALQRQIGELLNELKDIFQGIMKILSETNNNVTMAYEWYDAAEDISLPMIGENWDCFYDENYTYQWDEGKLSIFDGENCLYVLEYPTDKWYVNGNNARLENGIFYGASVMNGYAQPDTCFMFAYDLENEKLLWRSADQTYNSMNFLVKGDVIFCGYGFTAEDDYLYQLDKNTGEVIDRLPLKKMPDLMAEKDDRLYVHTYSYDYVIGIF